MTDEKAILEKKYNELVLNLFKLGLHEDLVTKPTLTVIIQSGCLG